MKPLTSVSIRTALLAVAPLAFLSCTQAPTREATAPAATATTVATPDQAAVGAPAAAATAVTERGVTLPVVTGPKPMPVYPVDMLRARRHGLVYVECVIDETGRVVTTSVHDSTDAAFNATTEKAVRQWTFKPGTRDGVPASMRVLVPVEYVDRDVSALP